MPMIDQSLESGLMLFEWPLKYIHGQRGRSTALIQNVNVLFLTYDVIVKQAVQRHKKINIINYLFVVSGR